MADSQKYIDGLKTFYGKHRRIPTYQEMLGLFRLKSKNAIFKIINKLIELGYLVRDQKRIAPTSLFFSLPLYGVIKAGYPILADEQRDYLTLDEYLITNPKNSFLLKVSGDSMENAGIFDGDIVVVEKNRHAQPGDIVLAQIDQEWTLKILKKDRIKKVSYLMAANPKYPPFYPKQELTIHGVVQAVCRKITN